MIGFIRPAYNLTGRHYKNPKLPIIAVAKRAKTRKLRYTTSLRLTDIGGW